MITSVMQAGILTLLFATAAMAEGFSVFGSVGAESQHAPANAESPLNPENFLALSSRAHSADFAVFLAFTPAGERWKVRSKLRGDAAAEGTRTLEVAEGSVQLQLNDSVDITVGRVIEKWGTGYGWTPTAFIGPARNPTDPTDRRSLSRGRDMVRLSAIAGETQVSLYLLERRAAAFRAHRVIAETDVALTFYRDRNVRREGVSLSRVVGDALELHLDASNSRGDDGKNVQDVVIGGQYTWRRANFVLELHHRSDGLSADEWSTFRNDVDAAARGGDFRALAAANRRFAPLGMRRDYSFIRVARSVPRVISEAELIAITNLHDRSSVVRIALTRHLARNVHMLVMNTEFLGASGSESSYIQVARITAVSLRLYF